MTLGWLALVLVVTAYLGIGLINALAFLYVELGSLRPESAPKSSRRHVAEIVVLAILCWPRVGIVRTVAEHLYRSMRH